MTDTTITKLKSSARAAEAATEELAGARRDLLDRIRQKELELSRAKNAPYPPAELADVMRTWLHGHLDRLHRDYGTHVPVTMGPSNRTPRAPGETTAHLIALLLRRVLDAEIEGFVEDLGDYDYGLPIAERPAVTERLEARLAELKAEDEALVNNAHDLGFSGPAWQHRPEVIQSRDREKSKREQEERQIAHRQEREREINERQARELTRQRAQRSAYLEANRRGKVV